MDIIHSLVAATSLRAPSSRVLSKFCTHWVQPQLSMDTRSLNEYRLLLSLIAKIRVPTAAKGSVFVTT